MKNFRIDTVLTAPGCVDCAFADKIVLLDTTSSHPSMKAAQPGFAISQGPTA